MAFYPDTGTFCEVMTDLFERAMARPETGLAIRQVGLVFRLVTTDPEAVLTVDGRAQPPQFTSAPPAGPADLVLRLPADLLHQIWLGEVRLRDAFFGGQVQVEGPMLRALGLANLFRQVEALYPQVLRERGLIPAA